MSATARFPGSVASDARRGRLKFSPRNRRILKTAIFFAGVAAMLFGAVRTASGSPLMVVTCLAPTGVNIASDIERDRPKSAVPEVYDPEAKAYVSHPRKTQSITITVNGDGTATETSFNEDGTAFVTNMRVLGTINPDAVSMIDDNGRNVEFDLVTLYPAISIAIFTGTSYFGWHKAIPTGYAYVSHCKFSLNVIN